MGEGFCATLLTQSYPYYILLYIKNTYSFSTDHLYSSKNLFKEF